jgi:hypothetical protein
MFPGVHDRLPDEVGLDLTLRKTEESAAALFGVS